MPKGALLHSHSGGIANTEWLVNKASEYNNCYVFTDVENQQNYLYGQLMIFKENEAPTGFVKLKDFLKNDSNGKEKLNQLLTLKRNNLSEYIDYWVNLKRFQRIGSLLNYRPIFKEYYRSLPRIGK
jgi:adenosine deaminase CECR1